MSVEISDYVQLWLEKANFIFIRLEDSYPDLKQSSPT
jgi:hypothetical protein